MEEQGTSGTAGYITIEEACGLLKMKKEEVEALHAQGRLEATRHESERRYSLPSVMLQRVETLMRRSPAEGKTRAVMEELASLQFQRGHLHGAEEIGTAAIEQVKKMSEGELAFLEEVKEELRKIGEQQSKLFAEMRAMDEGLLRRLRPKRAGDEEREGRHESAGG